MLLRRCREKASSLAFEGNLMVFFRVAGGVFGIPSGCFGETFREHLILPQKSHKALKYADLDSSDLLQRNRASLS